ncbi:MAG: DUF6526 family protein [Flavobacteriaceae bacterium]|nr:DUF6526 family protein [Flavobacteriaceae bacterium]
MENQNYKNHSKMVPVFHYLGGVFMLLLLIGSVVNLVRTSSNNQYSASLLVLVSVLFLIVSYYARSFALKAQDRAIRAEENFRHYLLSGKPFSKELKTRQIIGLRFASDDEFLDLAKRAVSEDLSEKKIKRLIKKWKPDTYRV